MLYQYQLPTFDCNCEGNSNKKKKEQEEEISKLKTNNHMFIECRLRDGFGVRIAGDVDNNETVEQSFSLSLSLCCCCCCCCCCCW